MNQRVSANTHLSIGYFSPSWPIGASPNGVVNYVGFLSEQTEARGHHTTILADAVVEGVMPRGFTIFRKSGPPSPEIRSTGSCMACGVGSQPFCRQSSYRQHAGDYLSPAIAEHGLDIFGNGGDIWLGRVASPDFTDSHLRPAAWPLVLERSSEGSTGR